MSVGKRFTHIGFTGSIDRMRWVAAGTIDVKPILYSDSYQQVCRKLKIQSEKPATLLP